jgi:hypothetical protein
MWIHSSKNTVDVASLDGRQQLQEWEAALRATSTVENRNSLKKVWKFHH